MTDTEGPSVSRRSPGLRVLRGRPSDEELAAVTAVLAALAGTRRPAAARTGGPRGALWPELWQGGRSPRSWATRRGGPAGDGPPRPQR
ncbi:acyl-CoA carboxylase epsilon subunit [Streptomyces sp. JHA26]|uniref:acyl-CoA carboxylase epsilon subunit n=1 Tax=Streptomyces sp. JHA26 TaxID=1917143 RepID=UPI00098B9C29|nr:acyl-CoA carboxylase epsilon subunit [Streptomyces sp. JHA26]